MYKYCRLLIVSVIVLSMAIPQFADARAGGGKSSMGSRGSRTYSPSPSAAPIQRSITPQKPAMQPQPSQGFNQPAAASATGSPFWRGVAGGFLGAGIGSLLFGGHGYANGAGGYGGGGSMFGGLLQILLIGGLAYWGYRFFKNNSARNANIGGNMFSGGFPQSNNYAEPEVVNSIALNITDNDKNYFEQLLTKIQHHWSEGDLTRLRMYVTPEMLQYFSEELSANSSRGVANIVENVTLERAEVTESWHEYELDYATARLEWSANDYMVRLDKNPKDSDYIASGSKTELTTAAEFWTFARSSGGNWLLSAIQQVG